MSSPFLRSEGQIILPIFQRIIARQLAEPTGIIGRVFTARWLNKANAHMNDVVFQQLAIAPGDRILEVGFGGGDLLQRILSSDSAEFVAGVDRSAEMVQLATKKLQPHLRNGRLELSHGDIELLPYPHERFTTVCTVNTIYFWQNPTRALSEVRRVLKPAGRFVVCFNSKQDMEAWPIHQHGFRTYEVDEVMTLLRATAFGKIEVTQATDAKQGLFYCFIAEAI